MAEEDDAQKTEDPSDKKLSDAKTRGEVPQSQEVKSWIILLGAAAGLIFLAPFMAAGVRGLSLPFIEQPDLISVDVNNLRRLLADTSFQIMLLLAPFMGLLIVLAIAGGLAQVGLILAPKKIKPEMSKISLPKGIKRMFSARTVVEFVKGIAKLLVVSLVALIVSSPLLVDLAVLPDKDFLYSLDRIQDIAIALTIATFGVMTFVAAMDYAYQKYSFTKQMMMSKQEVKDETKQQDGDPQIKARIRKVRMERSQQRMMAAVPEADVVITNPTHYAVALSYKMDEMSAPLLVAKGMDELAFRIRAVAEENDVSIVENPPLARALYAGVEIDEEIPAEHFQAVAEVIGFIMRQRGELSH